MVALVQRLRKLEKKVADRSQIGHLDDRVVYQPSAAQRRRVSRSSGDTACQHPL
jgi:hypothetical protein